MKEEETNDSTKRPRNQLSPDRISTLPESVLLHILSSLNSMKQAVTTGTLSKSWQYLWTSLSQLSFHNEGSQKDQVLNFVAFVNQTLPLCRCSNLETFSLNFRFYEKCFAPDVNRWIRFATRSNAERLFLETDGDHRLPQHLFTNSKLMNLRVRKCVVSPSGYVSWRSLKSLSLAYVALSDEVLAKILSGSPVLETLILKQVEELSRVDIKSSRLKELIVEYGSFRRVRGEFYLEISAPNLESLELFWRFYDTTFRSVNVSSLVKASINFEGFANYSFIYARYSRQLGELLEKLGHVKELQLGNWHLQVLSISVPKGLPSDHVLSCKVLTLRARQRRDFAGITWLLQSSPFLEKLSIRLSSFYPSFDVILDRHRESYELEWKNYWTSQKASTFECLRTVEIAVEDCGEYMFPLVQFLLQKAKVLEIMVVKIINLRLDKCSQCSVSQEFVQLTQKLLSFPRASPIAVVKCTICSR